MGGRLILPLLTAIDFLVLQRAQPPPLSGKSVVTEDGGGSFLLFSRKKQGQGPLQVGVICSISDIHPKKEGGEREKFRQDPGGGSGILQIKSEFTAFFPGVHAAILYNDCAFVSSFLRKDKYLRPIISTMVT